MGDEFHRGICASNLWNPTRINFGSSLLNDMGTFGSNQSFFHGDEYMSSNLDFGQEDFSNDLFKLVNQDFSLHQESFDANNYTSTFQDSLKSEFQQQELLFDTEAIKYSNVIGADFIPSTPEEIPNCPKLSTKFQLRNQEVRAVNNNVDEPLFKRIRIQTPSTLPTFKVRKDKLGDRVTALQQLVSPFGKTDTASVLHEAVDYINLLHAQLNVLTSQYPKNFAPIPQQGRNNMKNIKGSDLRSRGLCLVPISSTFPAATNNTTDFWTPSFGGAFF